MVSWTGRATAPLDEGEQQWGFVVKKGGKALFDARAKTRKKLETKAQRVAKLDMRQAHWHEYGEPETETASDRHETTVPRMVRLSREAEAEAVAKRNIHSQEDPHTRERLPSACMKYGCQTAWFPVARSATRRYHT
jgi:hypothetical protein